MLKLFSPAKLNLFLRILKKRADGFHEIASLFQTIDFGDWLTFDFAMEDQLISSDPTLACNQTNLVLKAVDLFRRKSGLQFCIDIDLDKRIPQQAGLGGGSSNAATTLWALNLLHGAPFAVEELQAWSLELGSDIPFFFSEGTAYCTGRGEQVRKLPPLRIQHAIALFKPTEGISTPAVFQALQMEECSPLDPEQLLEESNTDDPFFHNDLQAPAFRLLPKLKVYSNQLRQKGMRQITLSGSGSTLFGESSSHQPIHYLNRSPELWYHLKECVALA